MKKIYIDLCHTLVQQLADRVAYTSISRSKFDVLCKTYSRYQSNAFNADLFNEIFNAWNQQDLLAKDSNQALPFRLPPITYKNDQVNTPSYASAQFTLAPTTPLTGEEPINFVKYWLIISYFHQWGHEQMEHSNFDLTMCNVVSQVVLESINKYSKKFNADVTGTSESWPIIRFYHKQTQQLLMLAQNTYENFIQSLQRHIVFSNCIDQFFYQSSHYLERSLRCYENQRLKNHNQQIILKLKKKMQLSGELSRVKPNVLGFGRIGIRFKRILGRLA